MNIILYIKINDVIRSTISISNVTRVEPGTLDKAIKDGHLLKDSLEYIFIDDNVYKLSTDLSSIHIVDTDMAFGAVQPPIYLDYKKFIVPEELYDIKSPLYSSICSKLLDPRSVDTVSLNQLDKTVRSIINKLKYGNKTRFNII